MPKRITAARWLWTTRNQPDRAAAARHLTTPAGWLSYRLTGAWTLGIGDAAGMFPIDQQTQDYDVTHLANFEGLIADRFAALRDLLPDVRRAGDDAGALSADGAELLGLPVGIPVAAAEGDQPVSLAGALIGKAGMVSVSFGTSVCANSVGDRSFDGVSPVIDHFCAPDGKPINMVFLRNGTTFMNSVVDMFGSVLANGSDRFEAVMPEVLKAAPDCGGLLALPFMDDEPGLGVSRGGTAALVGLNAENATAGNAVKAALLATIFNLRIGSEALDAQGFPRTEIILTGGLTRTPELGQILADVFSTPVVVPIAAAEGCAWGAAVMAKFRQACISGTSPKWSAFLDEHVGDGRTRFEPNPAAVKDYERGFERYRRLVDANEVLAAALDGMTAEQGVLR